MVAICALRVLTLGGVERQSQDMVNRETWGLLVSVLGAALALGACIDPLDAVGVGEIVTEQRKTDPLADDRLEDKHPEYDATRTVVEDFNGCAITLNKSASVTRLTLQSVGARDESLRQRVFPNRAAAVAALEGAPMLPTIEVVNGALKPFNDGLYAAVELAAETGESSSVNKRQLLRDLLTELVTRSASGTDAEKPHAATAAEHIATAVLLGGDGDAVPADLAEKARLAADTFGARGIFSKPVGFYTWTPELESIFTRDRFMQTRYMPGNPPPPFGTFAELALVLGQNGMLGDGYARTLALYAGLTDPAFDASPFDLAPFVPDASALGNLGAVEASFFASRPSAYAIPECNPGIAAWPASETAENRMMRRLICNGEIQPDETLLDALIRRIQQGDLDLTPTASSGWYDHQLYALETLLAPDKAPESQHLLLTRAYKEKLVETFKSLLIQTRETHVKQIAPIAVPTSAPAPVIDFWVYPKLVVEPFPTFYLRTARAYRFVEATLASALGPDFLGKTSRVLEEGTRGTLSLAEELHDKELLLYGLHALSADSIGMAPGLAEDELAGFPLDEARGLARVWLAGVGADRDVARDARVSLLVSYDQGMATYWAVVGVKVLHLHASFPESRRPQIVNIPSNCHNKGWETFEPYLLVEKTLELKRSVTKAPLSREEFRALCDQYDNADDIRTAFESAP